jgi:hypothetical protein
MLGVGIFSFEGNLVQNFTLTASSFFRGIADKVFLSYCVAFQENMLKAISQLLPAIKPVAFLRHIQGYFWN